MSEMKRYIHIGQHPDMMPLKPGDIIPGDNWYKASDVDAHLAALQAELEGAYIVIKALLHIRAKPTKLIGALRTR